MVFLYLYLIILTGLFICVSVSSLIFQVIRVVPYSAVQLFAYEIYKVTPNYSIRSSNGKYYLFMSEYLLLDSQKIFRGENGRLSVAGRLAAGAFAGMTSTFVSN